MKSGVPAAEGKEKRSWKVQPAPIPRRPELMEVLVWESEISESGPEADELRDRRNSLGLELWSAVRKVQTWASTPRDHLDGGARRYSSPSHAERQALALAEAPELAGAITTFRAIATTPAAVAAHHVATACKVVSEWAYRRGILETAIQFGEAAAAVQPRNPKWANLAGRMNRNAGDLERARVWFERATALSRKSTISGKRRRRLLKEYSTAQRGLGAIHQEREEHAAALKCFSSAASAAREVGQKWLAAQTEHYLLLLAAELGQFTEAVRHARKALDWYPINNERIPALAHDFAFLLTRLGLYSSALPLLEKVLLTPIPLPDQVIGWSTFARCAGALRNRKAYERAKTTVLALSPVHRLHAPMAFLNLAYGAQSLREWELAEAYARKGIALASDRGLRDATQVGAALLEEILAQQPAPEETPIERVPEAKQIRLLTAEVGERLKAWRGPNWRGTRQFGVDDADPV